MHAADPTYPLYPIFCFVSVVMLFSVLLTSFVRQRWNFGVSSLCFWLFLELLSGAINAIIWSDNDDVQLYIYCDIGGCDSQGAESENKISPNISASHVKVISSIIKPMATLLLSRKLYLIASLRSVELPDRAQVSIAVISALATQADDCVCVCRGAGMSP